MIITRTPFRVSLFGGGTDYPAWYHQHGGSVCGFAINKYCYISVRTLPPFFEHRFRIVYSIVELVNQVKDIRHPAVRAILEEMGEDVGLEIHHDGDLPARSGLGSSSSFSVGFINALFARKGRTLSKQQLADEAIRVEQDVLKEHVGSQDQVWAAHGGLNRVDFHTDGSIDVRPIILQKERRQELLDGLLLYFTGISRYASDIAKVKIENLEKREQHVREMAGMVDEALDVLSNDNRPMREIGELLRQSWQLKRELANGVSTPMIDGVYNAAMDAGAVGGKLLGAGGGGFMLFYVDAEKRAAVKEALKKLVRVKFDIDTSGSKVVVYEPNGLENQ